LNLKFDTYQDVKNILYLYTYAISIILSLLVYFLVIPDNHRLVLNTVFGSIVELVPVGVIISIVFGFIVSGLFIHMFEVYDKVYDKFIIRWRYKYTRDFIFPELFNPFAEKLDKKFFKTAMANIREFMNIFYYFVGDRDMKIRKNAVVRFYEAIWKYWATQINEVFFILFGVMLIIYSIYFAVENIKLLSLVTPALIIVIFGVINRLMSKYFLKSVNMMTKEEIEEIHNNFKDELEGKIMDISQKFELSYGENNNNN